MKQSWLVIDVGNSSAKFGLVEDGVCTSFLRLKRGVQDACGVLKWLGNQKPKAACIALGKVAGWAEPLIADVVKQLGLPVVVVNPVGQLPFKSYYAVGQAGVDRLANVAAARLGGRPAIVVDAGSALTAEVIDRNGDFVGGCIMPGLRLQAEVLYAKTDQLPPVDLSDVPSAIGRDTEECIKAGLLYGTAGAVERLVEMCREELGTLHAPVILTGGDSELLVRMIKSADVRRDETLTLKGLLLLAKHQRLFT